MFRETIRFNSNIQIFEFNPSKNPSQIVKADNVRKPLKDFKHSYYNKKGYKEIAKVNLGSFHTPNLKSIHYGWLFWDSGHQIGTFSDVYTECWLDKENKFHVDNLKSDPKEKKWWGVSLFYPLVKNGKATIDQWGVGNNASRSTQSTSRTLIGQKSDGTMVLVRADKLTGKQSQQLMLELGCVQAINSDGGGSSQMQIGDKHYGSNRKLGSVLVVLELDENKHGTEKEETKVNSLNDVKISENFNLREFECKDGSNLVMVHPELLEKLQTLRKRVGLPVKINSGYRTPSHNEKVGGVKGSFHTKGMAADIKVSGYSPKQLAEQARSTGFRGIIAYDTFVHVDVRPTPYYRY